MLTYESVRAAVKAALAEAVAPPFVPSWHPPLAPGYGDPRRPFTPDDAGAWNRRPWPWEHQFFQTVPSWGGMDPGDPGAQPRHWHPPMVVLPEGRSYPTPNSLRTGPGWVDNPVDHPSISDHYHPSHRQERT